MDGLGSYSNGIFGGLALAADDGTGGGKPVTTGETKAWPKGDDFLGNKITPTGIDPTADGILFARDAAGIARIKPDVAAQVVTLLKQYSAGTISPENFPPGIFQMGLNTSVIVPSANVVGNPNFVALWTGIQQAIMGGLNVVLPKQVAVPLPSTATWLAFAGAPAVTTELAKQGSSNLFLMDLDTLKMINEQVFGADYGKGGGAVVKKAGMTVGTTLLIGATVLAAGYVGTRLIQKKPIFPKGK